MKNNNSSGTNGMHNPNSVTAIPLTKEHYMVIGNPRGHFESWENRNNNNFSQQNTNIASCTQAAL